MKPKFKTVGQIRKGNALFTYENHSAFDSVMELLHSRYTGMPVLNEMHQVVGVISETDLIRALQSNRPFEEIKVGEIMTRSPILIEEDTTLEKAAKIMEDANIPRLPVVRQGELLGTVTRHDLLRAWLGLPVEL